VSYKLDCTYNLVRADRKSDALTVAEEASRNELPSPGHYDTLGSTFTHCEQPRKALPFFEQACRLTLPSARFLFNLTSAQRMVGDVAGAERSLSAAIAIEPEWGDLYLSRAQLRRQTSDDNHIDQMKAALSRITRPESEIALGYALAKELEDTSRFSEAFDHLSQASRVRRKGIGYDVRSEIDLMEALTNIDYDSLKASWSAEGLTEYRPIFVFGLSRSGTTLVERVLASCRQTLNADEPHALLGATRREDSRNGAHPIPMTRFAMRSGNVASTSARHLQRR
jgi:tetratricopeptide (TPR) repeat protein